MSRRRSLANRVKVLLVLNGIITAGLLVLLAMQLVPQRLQSPVQKNAIPTRENKEVDAVRFVQHAGKKDRPGKDQQAEDGAASSPRLALVVDDLGFSATSPVVRGMLSLPVPLTASIIPGQAASLAIAERAHELGHQVIAHVPMEVISANEVEDLPRLRSGMSRAKFLAQMDGVEALPHAVGLSNHQGSAATQDSVLMRWVAEWCSRHGWFVFDSITHAGTLLYASARDVGVPALRRDVFLDHHLEPDSIRARLQEAVQLSKDRQRVVRAIVHPHASSLAVLQLALPELLEQGVKFERLTEGLNQRSASQEAGEVE